MLKAFLSACGSNAGLPSRHNDFWAPPRCAQRSPPYSPAVAASIFDCSQSRRGPECRATFESLFPGEQRGSWQRAILMLVNDGQRLCCLHFLENGHEDYRIRPDCPFRSGRRCGPRECVRRPELVRAAGPAGPLTPCPLLGGCQPGSLPGTPAAGLPAAGALLGGIQQKTEAVISAAKDTPNNGCYEAPGCLGSIV
jgi:hypothetical protein